MKTAKILPILLLLFSGAYAQQINVALNKPAEANSESPGFPAKNVTDGRITRNSKWMSANVKPPHVLEINLKRYCVISSIIVHTGIPEAERTPAEKVQAAGYWSAKNFKLQYWDDANWTDIPGTEIHENRLTDVKYTFAQPLNTYKIRFVCDDGEPINIMEIEAFGTENMTQPVPESNASGLKKKTVRTTDQNVSIKVENKTAGKTMRYVGYNQGYYMPGSNASGWLEYANVNSVRVWITLNSYAPLSAVQVDKNITTVDEFDRRKDQFRQDPEHNDFLKWDKLLPLFSDTEKSTNTNPMIFSYTLSELKRLHIDPIIQFGSVDFNDSWSNKWQQWQRYYALAYYAAKTGDVTMFAMQNEPNHKASGPMKLNQWIAGMKIVSDALTCAVEDVNKKYNKHLKARMVGPVTAGNNPEWWAEVAKNQRTDYHGKTIDHDLLGIFSTHSYNSPAAGYTNRVNDIRKILADNHPEHTPLPIVYTEIGRWMNAYLIDKEETMDSPSLFTEWAGIYTNNTRNQAYGMWAFKFSNTSSETYPFGVKSGHHFTWQGQRIIEDAYQNLALGKRALASSDPKNAAAYVTDGDKSNRSAWHSDSSSTEKWIEIDLGKAQQLGSSVVYTGSNGGTYTAPDRVKNFKLQYWDGTTWLDIGGTTEQNNKYAQVFRTFKQPVTTSKIRLVSNDPGVIKVREIKVFGANDGPAKNQRNYDVSGIQRTGEVVRLFATGFKDERPLMQTTISADDENLDCMTSYDAQTGNYYMWLVQRGLYNDHLKINLSSLPVRAGTPVTAQVVNPEVYGEVSQITVVNSDKNISLLLPGQSVVLLTIPSKNLGKSVIKPAADATVFGGNLASKNFGAGKELTVALNAGEPNKNAVSFIRFALQGSNLKKVKRILLKVNGYNAADDSIYRFHVYGIPAVNWQQNTLIWNNAPQLDKKEALITSVGQKAFVAGELAFKHTPKDHYLDVTQLIKKHAAGQITFALVRETRQLGDDIDKNKKVLIGSSESIKQPELIIWSEK